MTPHTLVIGNGFDLSLGLNTDYASFMKSDYFTSLTQNGNKLAFYLNRVEKLKNWVDIENELAKFSLNGSSSLFHNEYKDLKQGLNSFICEAEKKQINYSSKASNLLKELATNSSLKIVNFNYTDTARKVLDHHSLDADIIHIHGKASEKTIVFGIEDTAAFNREHSFLLKGYSQNIYTKESVSKMLMLRGNTSTIFGHSLGKTDYSQFSEFFTYMEKRRSVEVYYHDEESYLQIMNRIDALTNNNTLGFKIKHSLEMIGPKVEWS